MSSNSHWNLKVLLTALCQGENVLESFMPTKKVGADREACKENKAKK